MAVGGVVLNFVAKTADAISDTDSLSRALNNLGDKSGKAAGKSGVGGLFNTMATALPVIGAVAAGVAGAAVAMVEMGKAALADAQEARKLEDTLSRIPGVTQDMIDKNEGWISSMQLATLVSDTKLRAAVGKLALATGDLGEAQRATTIAVDAATVSGKSLSAITDAMSKAANGNTAALKKLFPWLDAGADGTLTYAEAMKQLDDKMGGAAKTAAKSAPFERLKVIWDELKEAVGNALIPLIDKFSKWMDKKENVQKIDDFTQAVGDLATKIGDKLVVQLQELYDSLKKPANQQKIQDWIQSAKDFASAMSDVAAAVKSVADWLGRLPNPPGWLKNILPIAGVLGVGRSAPAPGPSTRAATTTAAAPAPAQPTVIVTEEQVYRAISRLIIRGDGRNGRMVVVG